MVKSDVMNFLATNIYKNCSVFVLEDLIKVPETNLVYILIKNLDSEDLDERDTDWIKKLYKIGKNHGLDLRLPYWYYMK